jgi:ATP adenylyltransferase
MFLKHGTLWQEVVLKTKHALGTGALRPYNSEYELVKNGGMVFVVRILSSLEHKEKARKEQEEKASSSETRINPFLPYEEELFVTHISSTHAALLNKFNVVDHHLLVVTRSFEDQEMLLTSKDFEALWICLSEYDGLGFYNAGKAAGASQQHKHLQIVPLPLMPKEPDVPDVPIKPLLNKAGVKKGWGSISDFPFQHIFVRLNSNLVKLPSHAAKKTFTLYCEMLNRLGLESPVDDTPKRQSVPYCFLITRQWMLLVPRSREFFESISINALGFAGALLVSNRDQLDRLKQAGPMTALKMVSLPRI